MPKRKEIEDVEKKDLENQQKKWQNNITNKTKTLSCASTNTKC